MVHVTDVSRVYTVKLWNWLGNTVCTISMVIPAPPCHSIPLSGTGCSCRDMVTLLSASTAQYFRNQGGSQTCKLQCIHFLRTLTETGSGANFSLLPLVSISQPFMGKGISTENLPTEGHLNWYQLYCSELAALQSNMGNYISQGEQGGSFRIHYEHSIQGAMMLPLNTSSTPNSTITRNPCGGRNV